MISKFFKIIKILIIAIGIIVFIVSFVIGLNYDQPGWAAIPMSTALILLGPAFLIIGESEIQYVKNKKVKSILLMLISFLFLGLFTFLFLSK